MAKKKLQKKMKSLAREEKEIAKLLVDKFGFEKSMTPTDMAEHLIMEVFQNPLRENERDYLIERGVSILEKTKMRKMTTKDEFMTPLGYMTFTDEPALLWGKIVNVLFESPEALMNKEETVAAFIVQHTFLLGFVDVFATLRKENVFIFHGDGNEDDVDMIVDNTAQYILGLIDAIEKREKSKHG